MKWDCPGGKALVDGWTAGWLWASRLGVQVLTNDWGYWA